MPTAPTPIYTLSLHDALPIYHGASPVLVPAARARREGLTAALAKATTPKTKLLYWNSPVNPTGEVFSRSECERSEEHTSELQSRQYLVCRLLLEKKKEKSRLI